MLQLKEFYHQRGLSSFILASSSSSWAKGLSSSESSNSGSGCISIEGSKELKDLNWSVVFWGYKPKDSLPPMLEAWIVDFEF